MSIISSHVLGRDDWWTPISETGDSYQNLGQEKMAERTRELFVTCSATTKTANSCVCSIA